LRVGPLGVAASYGVPAAAVESAFERGVNYMYWGSRRSPRFADALRHLSRQRERMVLVLQSYSRVAALLDWSIERGLRALRFDYADVLLLGLWNRQVPERILDVARALQRRGLVRHLAVSSHNRPLVPTLAVGCDFDVLHFRYNAAHPGAELDIFPRLSAANAPGMVAYTATSWGRLLDPKKVPRGERVPTGADCYRFVLTRPEVNVCLTGPADSAQMEEALRAVELGPMSDEELAWMRRVGDRRSAAVG
jgi:aryl-alcohol dehydrogenase-like predicted oxidoreductase